MASALQIGWHEVDITPKEQVELSGQYYPRLSQGVHLPLRAVAWALERDREAFVMLSIDTVCILADLQTELRERLRERLPFDPGRLLLCATHTHSAPSFCASRRRWPKPEGVLSTDAYRQTLLDQLEIAVLTAWDNRQPAGFAHGTGQAPIGHCRRVMYADGSCEMYGATDRPDFSGLEAGQDSAFDLLACYATDGSLTGVVVNIPCPSQVMEATYQISSDFAGRLRQLIRERFGDQVHTLCQIAPAGDLSPRDLTRPATTAPFWRAAGVEIIARRLADAVEGLLPELAPRIDYDATLSHYLKPLSLPRRRATYPDYVAAVQAVAHLEAIQSKEEAFDDFCQTVLANEQLPDQPGPYDNKACHFVEILNHQAVIDRYQDQDDTPTYHLELHAVRIGEVAMVSNPFELFLDYGQRIRCRSAAPTTLLVQLAGDNGGYLPTARAEALGGYGALIVNGQVGSDGGAMLVDATLSAIDTLFS